MEALKLDFEVAFVSDSEQNTKQQEEALRKK